ncbi:hypothetical protein SEA_PUPPERS_48 [Gordonia phage Puppers]|nr:hypothetical protein SEA_PUPPERS_48 [Gordonia phage Puppers]
MSTMANPFTTATEAPATEGQVKFLADLLGRKNLGQMSPSYRERAEEIRAAIAGHRLQLLGRPLTKAGASALITLLKAMDDALDLSEGMEGFWTLVRDERANGLDHEEGARNVYKVQRAVHGSGRLYAKVLDPETGDWIISRGAVRDLRQEGQRLTLEVAKDLGHLYGRCIACGRTLTDEASIRAGIGPVCAAKF